MGNLINFRKFKNIVQSFKAIDNNRIIIDFIKLSKKKI